MLIIFTFSLNVTTKKILSKVFWVKINKFMKHI